MHRIHSFGPNINNLSSDTLISLLSFLTLSSPPQEGSGGGRRSTAFEVKYVWVWARPKGGLRCTVNFQCSFRKATNRRQHLNN